MNKDSVPNNHFNEPPDEVCELMTGLHDYLPKIDEQGPITLSN